MYCRLCSVSLILRVRYPQDTTLLQRAIDTRRWHGIAVCFGILVFSAGILFRSTHIIGANHFLNIRFRQTPLYIHINVKSPYGHPRFPKSTHDLLYITVIANLFWGYIIAVFHMDTRVFQLRFDNQGLNHISVEVLRITCCVFELLL